MFYQRDFISLTTRTQHTNRLQEFPQKNHNCSEEKKIFQKFADQSSVHGFSYIFNLQLHKSERYLWAFIVAFASVLTIYVCNMLSAKYSDRTLMTVVENSQYPVFKIDFPAIGICSKHRVNWGRIQLARKKFLPINASNETIEMFMRFVKRLDSLEYVKFENINGLEKEPLHLIDNLSIYKIAYYLSFRCEEILISGTCKFAGQPFDCCKAFFREKTNKGICLVFNSVVSPQSRQKAASDKFYPYKNSKNGEGSGLIFKVKQNLSTVIPGLRVNSGIDLMIKNPDQWTEWKTYNLRVNSNNEIILQPQLTVTHPSLMSFPLSFRKCLFEHEKLTKLHIPSLNYNILNCKTQCHQEYIIKYCNCTIPIIFSQNGITAPECKPSDYICVYKLSKDVLNEDSFSTIANQSFPIINCSCPPGCTSLTFPITMNTIPAYNFSGENMTTRVDIFYQSEVIMKYLTTTKYSITDLIGYFGGIVTLFVGVSVITVVEFVHLAILEFNSCSKKKTPNAQPLKGRHTINFWKK